MPAANRKTKTKKKTTAKKESKTTARKKSTKVAAGKNSSTKNTAGRRKKVAAAIRNPAASTPGNQVIDSIHSEPGKINERPASEVYPRDAINEVEYDDSGLKRIEITPTPEAEQFSPGGHDETTNENMDAEYGIDNETVVGEDETFEINPEPSDLAATGEIQLVCFSLAGEEFGVDIRKVQEIIRVVAMTRVPEAPAYARGIINLRGHIIPVIDLRTRIGYEEIAYDRHTRIIVLDYRGDRTGLIVDGVTQVLRVTMSQLEKMPAVAERDGHKYMQGIFRQENKLVMILDLEKILNFNPELP